MNEQAEYWGGAGAERWLANQRLLRGQLADISDALIAAAAPRAGERALEIGCGTGDLASRIADRVGSSGDLVCVDISEPLLAVASAAAPRIAFRLADAQVDALPDGRDLILSRFGLMFFADPPAAFANLRAAARAGGRLCFVCWGPLADSPCWSVPLAIAEARLGPRDATPAGTPGPLSLADPGHLLAVLEAGGWADIAVDTRTIATRQASLDDAVEVAIRMGPTASLIAARAPDPATLATIRAEVARAMAGYATADGAAVPASVHVVTAINPG